MLMVTQALNAKAASGTTIASGRANIHTIEHLMSALCGMGVDNRQLALLFLEDPATMDRLAPGICHGCNVSECPHYAAFSRRGDRRRR